MKRRPTHKECKPDEEFLEFLDRHDAQDDKCLTIGELELIENRFDEIEKAFEVELPDSVADALEYEVIRAKDILEKSMKACQRSHLKLVR